MHPDGLCLDKGGTELFLNGNKNENTMCSSTQLELFRVDMNLTMV